MLRHEAEGSGGDAVNRDTLRAAYEQLPVRVWDFSRKYLYAGYEQLLKPLNARDTDNLRELFDTLVTTTERTLAQHWAGKRRFSDYKGVVWTQDEIGWLGKGMCTSRIYAGLQENNFRASIFLTLDQTVVAEERALGDCSRHERAITDTFAQAQAWCEKIDASWVGKALPERRSPAGMYKEEKDLEQEAWEDIITDLEEAPMPSIDFQKDPQAQITCVVANPVRREGVTSHLSKEEADAIRATFRGTFVPRSRYGRANESSATPDVKDAGNPTHGVE